MSNGKSVYLSPEKPSEFIPLLAEGLLLFDKVAIDVSNSVFFEVIGRNIDSKTMNYLVESNAVEFVAQTFAPLIINQDDRHLNSIMLLDHKANGIPVVDFMKIDKAFKSRFNAQLIKSIEDKIRPVYVDHELLLENCANDFSNSQYCNDIFKFVKEQFDLPEFEVELQQGGCLFHPRTTDTAEVKRVLEEASYGLHLIAEVNYKLALTQTYDEVVCESEFQRFFTSKLRQAFKTNGFREQSNNFLELCEIHKFADVKELVGGGLLSLADIISLREKHGKMLRLWMSNVTNSSRQENEEFVKAYAKAITSAHHGLPLPMRTVVFGLLQTLSLVKPYTGLAVSTVQEFALPKLVNKWQPKLFFDKARKLESKNRKIRGLAQ